MVSQRYIYTLKQNKMEEIEFEKRLSKISHDLLYDHLTHDEALFKLKEMLADASPKRLNTLEFTKEYFKDRSDYMFKDENEINDFLKKWWNSQSVPPANTVTDAEIEKEIDKGLARSDYPSYEKDSGYRSGFQACVKWSRDRLSQPPEPK